MGRLYLLRHAKAKWADPGMRDYDRALDPRGLDEAAAMGRAIAERALKPEVVICSNAVRARQTLEQIDPALDIAKTAKFTDELYATDAPGYLEIATGAADADSVMLIGHNPMLEDLAIGLATQGDEHAISELQMGFRTAGLAAIDFDGPPSTFDASGGSLALYLTPDDL